VKKYFVLLLLSLLVVCCKKKDAPKPPKAALLIFPFQNSECHTGVDLNATTSRVEFTWQPADFTDTYELRVTNTASNITQTVSTSQVFAQLPLEKGAPYSWQVVSRNDETEDIASSATWQFYNAGFEISYAPFPAQVVRPESGSRIVKDINNEVELEWFGADVDGDIIGYEVYFGRVSPPVELVASPSVSVQRIKVDVMANTTYFWKVLSIDSEGNTSDSGIFTFKAL
jgi:hypothetical protein